MNDVNKNREKSYVKTILRTVIAVGALITPGMQVPAQTAQSGNVIYQVPKGWKRMEQNKVTFLVPSDLPPGRQAMLVIVPGQKLQGEFKQAFGAMRKVLEQDQKVVQEGKLMEGRGPGNSETVTTVVITEDDQKNTAYRFYYAAKPGDRFEMIAYLSNDKDLFNKYQPVVAEFCKGVTFANLKGGAEPAAGTDTPPVPEKNDEPERGTEIEGQGRQSAEPTSAAGNLTRVGNQMFRMPAGWKKREQGKLTLISPAENSGNRQLVILLLPSIQYEGEFVQSFENLLKSGITDEEKVTQEGKTEKQSAKNGVDIYSKMMVVEAKDGSVRTVRLYLGAKVGKRMEIAAILTGDNELFTKYRKELEAFLTSWTFAEKE
jgi:hypothetical protein